jgi:hypothetical protein
VKQVEHRFLEGKILGVGQNFVGVSMINDILVPTVSRDNDHGSMLVEGLAIDLVDLDGPSNITGNLNNWGCRGV